MELRCRCQPSLSSRTSGLCPMRRCGVALPGALTCQLQCLSACEEVLDMISAPAPGACVTEHALWLWQRGALYQAGFQPAARRACTQTCNAVRAEAHKPHLRLSVTRPHLLASLGLLLTTRRSVVKPRSQDRAARKCCEAHQFARLKSTRLSHFGSVYGCGIHRCWEAVARVRRLPQSPRGVTCQRCSRWASRLSPE
jgi:hypothetical protein